MQQASTNVLLRHFTLTPAIPNGVLGHFTLILCLLVCTGCAEELDEQAAEQSSAQSAPDHNQSPLQRFQKLAYDMPADIVTVDPSANAERNAYFGDLHVHSTYSFDAFSYGTIATPYDAYRYAKGARLRHPGGFDVQLREPLDFYAVTDHALYIGAMNAAADPSTEFSQYEPFKMLHNLNSPDREVGLDVRARAMPTFIFSTFTGIDEGAFDLEAVNKISRDTWSDIVAAAQQHNDPGKFTTFVGYEYTSSSDQQGNLHRNVIFRGADKLPAIPFSRLHSRNPEGLWDWMDGLREQGIEALAIPHNANGSNGAMFELVDWANNPMDEAYTRQRIRNEPLIEITQIKGTSETHPALSPNDEWADFEIMAYKISIDETNPSEPKGSYARDALKNGLKFQEKGISNPYKFGFIGSSDTHNAYISDDESNHFMKMGLRDSTPELRGSVPLTGQALEDAQKVMAELNEEELPPFMEVGGELYARRPQILWGASGLAVVWAEENTRDAIYDAFRRKETFATSGARMKIRFFGGYGFDEATLTDDDMVARAYAEGVSMGSDLPAKDDAAPSFIVWAMRDALSVPLQRLQVIKGWTNDGQHHEQVYDVACSDGNQVDADTHRCPDNGAKVNLSDCSISRDVGAAELKAVWTDPDFNPDDHAFYYLRALENPTCRWSTWDALRAGVEPREDAPKTIQERAWSSPIWYIPVGSYPWGRSKVPE